MYACIVPLNMCILWDFVNFGTIYCIFVLNLWIAILVFILLTQCTWAQSYGCGYRKQRISTSRSRQSCQVYWVSRELLQCLCVCIVPITRHSLLTQLTQKFGACTVSKVMKFGPDFINTPNLCCAIFPLCYNVRLPPPYILHICNLTPKMADNEPTVDTCDVSARGQSCFNLDFQIFVL